MGELLSGLAIVKDTHEAVHTFVDWAENLALRYVLSCFREASSQLGCTYMCNFAGIVKYVVWIGARRFVAPRKW